MNKKLTPLEALEELVFIGKSYNTDGTFFYLEKFYKNKIETLEKSLKALEIIKKKKVNVNQFIFIHTHNCCNEKIHGSLLEYYNTYYTHSEEEKLTQEEYDLLKEVLL